jgi:hypothetical protein
MNGSVLSVYDFLFKNKLIFEIKRSLFNLKKVL